MRIAVDAMGGDYAPAEVVKGAVEAVQENRTNITLVGKEAVIRPLLQSYPSLGPALTVANADDVIGFDERPVKAVRTKRNSSIVVGMDLLQKGKAQAFVSAGHSGAVVAAAMFELGLVKGIKRPALGVLMPTLSGFSLFLDAGANTKCDPPVLEDFARLGTGYMKGVFGVANPRVGLLSNGEEKEKGTSLVIKAHELLQKSGLNFIGNIEGKDIPTGISDVIVTDGFTGNVVLKTIEGASEIFTEFFKELLSTDSRFKEAMALFKVALGAFSKKFDYSEHGGSLVFGVNGNVLVAHGRSRAKAIKSAIRLARRTVELKTMQAVKVADYALSRRSLFARPVVAASRYRLSGKQSRAPNA